MPQINLLREGFVSNTLTPLGAISGSQVISPLEIDRLADNDTATTALIVSETKFISLDADLGARFKINKIELYTAEALATNFDVFVSDDGDDFLEVTMTGSSGLYVSEIGRFTTTTSGSPRYVRYEHRAPAVNATVQELKVLSDDSLVDFGSSGNLTQLEVSDAPIGKPSDQVTTLTLFNKFSKNAEGFVFVDKTENAAETQIEVALSPSGPWFGKGNTASVQPTNTAWEAGEFSNTRVVPSSVFSQSFSDGNAKGWIGVGASTQLLDGAIRGTSSTLTPRIEIDNDFTSFQSDAFYREEIDALKNHFSFRAVDANRVKIHLRTTTPLELGNVLEGPRLFWRTEETESATNVFRNTLSALPMGGSRPPTGTIEELIFDVGTAPTWSGTIRGFAIQPFTVATGTNILFDLFDVEAYHTEGNRVALDFRPVNSGTFVDTDPNNPNKFTIDSSQDTASQTVLSTRHVVIQDCIITRVRVFGVPFNTGPGGTIFLARPTNTGAFPNPGTNFTAQCVLRIGEDTGTASFFEFPVFWPARKGDIVGYTLETLSTTIINFSTISAVLGDAYTATNTFTVSSLGALATGLNAATWTAQARNYLIGYDAIPTELERLDGATPYFPSGTYTTPAFDVGVSPALSDLTFDSSEPAGTSIDTLGASGFKTVKARANETPPRTNLSLGDIGTVSGTSQTLFLHLNDAESIAITQQHVYQINTNNEFVANREGENAVNNFGGAILYHAQKDELWVVNCIISGTNPFNQNDARPVWDRYNPHTGEYLGTQGVGSTIFYSYEHPNTSANNRAFEPAGFVADYDREELYLFSREDAFKVGAGEYHTLVLDLNGNFKDVLFRTGAIGGTTANLNSVIGFTYAPEIKDPTVQEDTSGIFFTLSTDTTTSKFNQGTHINAYSNGNDDDIKQVDFINSTAINSIPGLSWATNPPDARGIVYNQQTGLLNLFFETQQPTLLSSAKLTPVTILLRPTFNTSSNTFEYTVVGSGVVNPESQRNVNGYERENADSNPDWAGEERRFLAQGNDDGTGFTVGMAHNTRRDTLVFLRNYESWRSHDFPFDTAFVNWDRHNHTFLSEIGAGTFSSIATPRLPNPADVVWGTLSGTLSFQDISTEGFNFPTGRYAQVRYQLNSNINGKNTPVLIESRLGQGIRVGTVPANGTKDIFVRTNIPADQTIGDQVGRIKSVFETEE